jgi:hypothetical protein
MTERGPKDRQDQDAKKPKGAVLDFETSTRAVLQTGKAPPMPKNVKTKKRKAKKPSLKSRI